MMRKPAARDTRTAAQAYDEHSKAIEKLLKALSAQLEDLRKCADEDPLNWSMVGSLEEVRDRLTTTVSFLANEEE